MKHLWTYLFVGILLTVPLWLHDQYFLHILITTGIFIIGAMSLNLLLGFTGQLSLGHIAFFGIGAYTSALTSLGFDIPIFGDFRIVHQPWHPVAGILLGTLVAGLFGYIVGKLSFKIRGAYFVIVTISFAEVVRLVALNWVDLTQGPLALSNIPPIGFNLPLIGEMVFWQKAPNYYLVLGLAFIAYVLIQRIVRSRMGRAMIALRENEPLATSVGIDVTRYLVFAAVAAAALAGAAGGLYAHYIRIIDPDIFLFIYTVTMVIMVVTGGKGTLAGPVVGGLIFGVLPVGLRAVAAPEVQWIVYGVVMILIVFFLPRGIVPAVSGWWHRKTGSAPAHVRPATSNSPSRWPDHHDSRNKAAHEAKLASAKMLSTRMEMKP
ncbi:branched-chain amino acid ABC transporter permease [Undibacterium arcticum]|uniref:Branched-chain amino acid ABC transporter permease n=1 Tax=Undibacterium arcticum TaxID=1762892 RepID=A0ABV7EWY4_9BURK